MSSPSPSSCVSPVLPVPKQIRFVNNGGQPPAKRRRINAACRTCRKRKTRCDGKRPLCSTCIENGHECFGYADGVEMVPGKRGSKDSVLGLDKGRGGDFDNEEEDDNKKPRGNGKLENTVRRSPEVGMTKPRSRPYLESGSNPLLKHRDTGNSAKGIDGSQGVYRESAIYDDESSPLENQRVPYFRYFGPTAIVPGFKQMVVSVREHRRSIGATSAVGMSPGSGGSVYGTPSHASDSKSAVDMPIYNQEDSLPVHRLIIHLVETFFAHMGSNYPFLRQEFFVQRVEERSAEPILVDAVCALAARFSDHPLLSASHDSSYPKSDYGHVFARRAKAAVVDTFPCPSIAAVQACLLLAYEGFGSNQDSALWMYLGCAIRMAVDLGLQKLDGVKYQGEKDPAAQRVSTSSVNSDPPAISTRDKNRVEKERVDTLWAVFMLDRVISSGTGRPVTLRGKDFELTFPALDSFETGWPNPFPALIQIIHLYGRVSDLLNNIRDVKDVTQKKIDGLTAMEKDLTLFYQKLDTRLIFNAANFQHYAKIGEGTNFILVHFWFHTLIMLVHQPTLMHSFKGQIRNLLPNSRELSMSSAKTIADILSFAELIDPRSFIGNPFTSQPMYIAACAFLMETAAHTSQPSSRDVTPPQPTSKGAQSKSGNRAKDLQKHSLLASAANQNYQRCYKALQQLESYWSGTRYILVALDQKAKGIWDPETYTEQEYESTKSKHDMIPNWRRKLSLSAPSPGRLGDILSPILETAPGSPQIDHSQAIGWSLTGTTNSPSSNLTLMYQNNRDGGQVQQPPPPTAAGNMIYDPIRSSLPESTAGSTSAVTYPPNPRIPLYISQLHQQKSQAMAPLASKYSQTSPNPASKSSAEMAPGLKSSTFAQTPGSHHSFEGVPSPNNSRSDIGVETYGYPHNMFPGPNSYLGLGGAGDIMMMQSQDIDMSTIGGDMMPWLEYLPQDVLNYFDGGRNATIPGDGSMNGNVKFD